MAQLIIALDLPDLGPARSLATHLAPLGVGFKVGLELLLSQGPRAVQTIAMLGPVFADAKFHDIPNTVRRSARGIGRTGPAWVTAHALGGGAMLEAARDGLAEGALALGLLRPKVLAVTVLTSHDATSLKNEVGLAGTASDEAMRLAEMALGHGADGIVCSPLEAARMRAAFGSDVLLATPGVRALGENTDDQRRTTTAFEAVRSGSDLVIVGRPVTGASDPVARARALLSEVEAS